jgi:putative membrane protein
MYEWVKVAHLASVISWIVGFLYLPRLMVYHVDAEIGSVQSETFKVMERRLLKGIMTPAMLASWVFGLWLMVLIEGWTQGWFVAKLFLVLILSVIHMITAKWVREFDADERNRTSRFFRLVNEIPAVLMVLVLILVIVKPF